MSNEFQNYFEKSPGETEVWLNSEPNCKKRKELKDKEPGTMSKDYRLQDLSNGVPDIPIYLNSSNFKP